MYISTDSGSSGVPRELVSAANDTTQTTTQSMNFCSTLTSQQIANLRIAGVEFSDFSLDDNGGILLDNENTARALAVLKMVSYDERPTHFVGIKRIGLKPAANVQNLKPALDPEHARFRQMYVAACMGRNGDLFAQARQALIQYRTRFETLQTQLILELRATALEERKAKGLNPVDRSALADEFDLLMQSEKVRSVTCEPGSINVYTKMLQCVDPNTGTRHDIGEFLIKIYIDGQADAVRWFNLSQRLDAARSQQQAPNVWNSGRASFADIRDNFPDLIASMQFSVVTMLAIEFIEQTTDRDELSEQIAKWPIAGK